MSFTYPSGNAVFDLTRLLIPDTDSAQPIFTDDEINLFLNAESSQSLYVSAQAQATAFQGTSGYVPQIYSPFFAAALALDSLAGSRARLASVLQLLDVKLDASKAAAALKDQAQEYRQREIDRGSFAIAEQVTTVFQARERVWAQWLRLYGGG